jgi:hypothetical protein
MVHLLLPSPKSKEKFRKATCYLILLQRHYLNKSCILLDDLLLILLQDPDVSGASVASNSAVCVSDMLLLLTGRLIKE